MKVMGEMIKKYLNSKGIKQIYLAKRTGLTQNALNALLNGRRNLEVEEYFSICEALGVEFDFFRKRGRDFVR